MDSSLQCIVLNAWIIKMSIISNGTQYTNTTVKALLLTYNDACHLLFTHVFCFKYRPVFTNRKRWSKLEYIYKQTNKQKSLQCHGTYDTKWIHTMCACTILLLESGEYIREMSTDIINVIFVYVYMKWFENIQSISIGFGFN